VEIREFNPLSKKYRKEFKKIALVYPNRYKAGISNLGLQQIYSEINSLNNFICERFYSDVFNGERSVESGSRLEDFDTGLFTIQYEEDYLKAVELSIKVAESIAGGPCIMMNPLPLKEHFKSFFIGEADDVVDRILNGDKIEGLYDGRGKVKRRYVRLDEHLKSQIIGTGAYGEAVLLEVGRGCRRRCRFCVVRQLYSPCRWRKLSLLLEVAEENRKYSDKIALIAPSPSDHPQFKELISELLNMGYMVSPSSMRADTVDEELMEMVSKGGLKSITFAPEAGSEKLREAVNKGISEDDILNAVEITSSRKIQKLKLYFMIGLPGEKEEDIKAIIELVNKVKKFIPRITVSINPLVPKPHTPFQWLPFGGDESKTPEENIKVLKNKVNFLRKELRKLKVNVEAANVDRFAIQTILSRGDEKVGRALKGVKIREFRDCLKQIDVDIELPWDFIDHGYSKSNLKKEYEKASY
jgi:radical SAM superfamily enzyme YgiQ (UPF0313 family)